MGKKRRKAGKKRSVPKKRGERKTPKAARKKRPRTPDLPPFLRQIARKITELWGQVTLAKHKFEVAKKQDPDAPNESLHLRRDIGEEVQQVRAGRTYRTAAVARLAEAAGFSEGTLDLHARFAFLPEATIDRLVREGRSWRWISENMPKLEDEKERAEPRGINDLDF